MSTGYEPAEGLRSVANELADAHHPHLVNNGVMDLMKFVSVDKPIKVKGKVVHVEPSVIRGLPAWLALRGEPMGHDSEGNETDLAESFFVLKVHGASWANMATQDRNMWTDLALKRCESYHDKHGNVKIRIRDFDVKSFPEIMQRHGVQSQEEQAFI